jgi:hypothetical protein
MCKLVDVASDAVETIDGIVRRLSLETIEAAAAILGLPPSALFLALVGTREQGADGDAEG